MALLRFDEPALDHAVEVAPRVWWVGAQLHDDPFKCHAYLVEAGDQSALIDPGSVITIEETLAKVAEVVPLDHVRWFVCHHTDPDIVSGLPHLEPFITRQDARLVTEWRAAALLRHYGSRIPFHLIEQHDWRINLGDGRSLEFALTPYLHFPGAYVTFERSAGVLFSSDLFGGFNETGTLFAHGPDDFAGVRRFHEHYMPSRWILRAGLQRLRSQFPNIELIAPQHGYLIPGEMVEELTDQLRDLECGVFLLARTNLDLDALLQVSEATRRIIEAMLVSANLGELAATAQDDLAGLLPLRELSIETTLEGEGLIRFDARDGFAGRAVETPTRSTPRTLCVTLPTQHAADPPATLVLELHSPIALSGELVELFSHVAPALRTVLERHLSGRQASHEQAELRSTAMTDPLTGLLNRRALEDRELVAVARAVLMIDLDHFKRVNDTYGHEAGDDVLRHAAASIREAVRSTDAVIRVGGEELLVVLGRAAAAIAVAERLRAAIARPVQLHSGESIQVTASVGVAARREGEPLTETIARADAALYAAKEAGRDRTASAEPPEVGPPEA